MTGFNLSEEVEICSRRSYLRGLEKQSWNQVKPHVRGPAMQLLDVAQHPGGGCGAACKDFL